MVQQFFVSLHRLEGEISSRVIINKALSGNYGLFSFKDSINKALWNYYEDKL